MYISGAVRGKGPLIRIRETRDPELLTSGDVCDSQSVPGRSVVPSLRRREGRRLAPGPTGTGQQVPGPSSTFRYLCSWKPGTVEYHISLGHRGLGSWCLGVGGRPGLLGVRPRGPRSLKSLFSVRRLRPRTVSHPSERRERWWRLPL